MFHHPNNIDVRVAKFPVQIHPIGGRPFARFEMRVWTQQDAPRKESDLIQLEFGPLRFAWDPQEFRPNHRPRPSTTFAKFFPVGVVRIDRSFRTVGNSATQEFQHFPIPPFRPKRKRNGPVRQPSPSNRIPQAGAVSAGMRQMNRFFHSSTGRNQVARNKFRIRRTRRRTVQ